MSEGKSTTCAPTLERQPAPLCYVDPDKACFAGPLGYNARHAHAVPVYIAGIYDGFNLRIEDGTWSRCRTAIIPAGVAYELDVGGNPLAVFYVEPSVASVESLRPLIAGGHEEKKALLGSAGEIALMRELYEDHNSARWANAGLSDLLAHSQKHAAKPLDPRIAAVVEKMHNPLSFPTGSDRPVDNCSAKRRHRPARRDGADKSLRRDGLQAHDVSNHVVAVTGRDQKIGHGGVRCLQPDRESPACHSGGAGDACEAGGLGIGRGAFAFLHRVAFGAMSLCKYEPKPAVAHVLRVSYKGNEKTANCCQPNESAHVRSPRVSGNILSDNAFLN